MYSTFLKKIPKQLISPLRARVRLASFHVNQYMYVIYISSMFKPYILRRNSKTYLQIPKQLITPLRARLRLALFHKNMYVIYFSSMFKPYILQI